MPPADEDAALLSGTAAAVAGLALPRNEAEQLLSQGRGRADVIAQQQHAARAAAARGEVGPAAGGIAPAGGVGAASVFGGGAAAEEGRAGSLLRRSDGEPPEPQLTPQRGHLDVLAAGAAPAGASAGAGGTTAPSSADPSVAMPQVAVGSTEQKEVMEEGSAEVIASSGATEAQERQQEPPLEGQQQQDGAAMASAGQAGTHALKVCKE